MKKIIILLILVIISTTTNAQQFVKGTNVISAGIGLGSAFGDFTYSTQTPALSLQYEKGVWDVGGPGVVSLGGYVGFKSFKNSGSYEALGEMISYTEKWNYTIIGVRSAYHYNGLKADKVDVYGGLMLSYNVLNYNYSDSQGYSGSDSFDNKNYGSTVGFSIYVGGRYFFSDNAAAFAELGYGISYLTLGISLKF